MKTLGKSFWLDYHYKPRKALEENIETDVIIIGGGITGASAAYHLSKSDMDFVLLEKNVIGAGSTGKSAGSFVPGIESDFFEAVGKFGARKAVFLWKSMINVIHDVKREIRNSRIDCDFSEASAFYVARDQGGFKALEKEYKETNKYGLQTILLSKEELKEYLNVNSKFRGALKYECDAEVNPPRLARGLVSKIKSGRIFENTEAKKIEHRNGMFSIDTGRGLVRSRKLVLATEAFTNSLGIIRNRINSIKVCAAVTERIAKDLLEEIKFSNRNLMWDTGALYNFIRMTKDNRILVTDRNVTPSFNDKVSGGDIENLRKQLIDFFPQLKDIKMEYGWAGNIGFTSHRLPMIGQDNHNKNLLYSLGYGGHGMTLGFLGGKMLSEICRGTPSDATKDLLAIFKPKDKSLLAAITESHLVRLYVNWLKLVG